MSMRIRSKLSSKARRTAASPSETSYTSYSSGFSWNNDETKARKGLKSSTTKIRLAVRKALGSKSSHTSPPCQSQYSVTCRAMVGLRVCELSL